MNNKIIKAGNNYDFTYTPGYVSSCKINLMNNVYFSIYITKNVNEKTEFDKVDIIVAKYDKHAQIVKLNISTHLTKNKRIKDMKCNINYLEKEYMNSGMEYGNPFSRMSEYEGTREWKSIKPSINDLIISINNNTNRSVYLIRTSDGTINLHFSYVSEIKMFRIYYERGFDYDSPLSICETNIYLGDESNKNNILKQLNKFHEFL